MHGHPQDVVVDRGARPAATTSSIGRAGASMAMLCRTVSPNRSGSCRTTRSWVCTLNRSSSTKEMPSQRGHSTVRHLETERQDPVQATGKEQFNPVVCNEHGGLWDQDQVRVSDPD